MWSEFIKKEQKKEYFIKLQEFVDAEYKTKTIYPKKEDIYNAFNYSDFKNTKVVMLGQDPYHDENQAHGLAFSVQKGCKIPPSLRNIYKELNSDLGIDIPKKMTDSVKSAVIELKTIMETEEIVED